MVLLTVGRLQLGAHPHSHVGEEGERGEQERRKRRASKNRPRGDPFLSLQGLSRLGLKRWTAGIKANKMEGWSAPRPPIACPRPMHVEL
jgi:hypothetical protein